MRCIKLLNSYHGEKLNTWIKENPNKCLLPENRHPLKNKEEVDFEL